MTPVPTGPSPIAVPGDHGELLLLEAPPGWLMTPPTPPARLALLDPNASGGFWPNVNVVIQDLGTMTPEEYLTLGRLQLKAMGEQARVEHDEPIGPGSSGGRVMEFVAYNGQVPVRCRQLILLQGGSAYVVTATAAAHQFEAYRPRFDRVFSSVALRLAGTT
jgi:hypothetical protein